ncbi:t-SNARE [Backusella circina FSU 941]|nr:t-SNARE [Backusella circina FSU 941]
MSVNRLADLHNSTQNREEALPVEMNLLPSSHQKPPPSSGNNNNTIETFLSEIVYIKETVKKISQNTDSIESMTASVFQYSDAAEIQRSRRAMDELSSETQTMMEHVRQKLKEIEPRSGQSELRTRKNTFSSVTELFMNSIKRRRLVASNFQKAEEQQLERQIKIANPNATPQEIQDTLNNVEQGKTNVFTDQILEAVDSQYRRQSAQDTLYAAQERREDLYKLSKRVNELSELFSEMQTLVEQQQYVFDQVEENLEKTNVDLEAGLKDLNAGVDIARKTRILRRNFAIGITIAIIIIILIIVLAVYFKVR